MSRIGPLDPGTVALSPRRSLTDLLWVANTRHGPGGHWFARVTVDDGDHDHLATAEAAVRYLADHEVNVPSEPPLAVHLAHLNSIRAMTRGLLDPGGGWTESVRVLLAATRFHLDSERGLAADALGWAGFAGDLLLPLIELVGIRDRLAICANPLCRLVFLDGSKSGTRRWCDDGGCGNRDRVGRHRRRSGASDRVSAT